MRALSAQRCRSRTETFLYDGKAPRANGPCSQLSCAPISLAGNNEVDGFRALALLVGLDLEGDALSFKQRFQSGALHGSDVHEHISPAVIRFNEAVAALAIEKFDRTGHCHRATPSPVLASPPAPTARRLGRTSTRVRLQPKTASVTPPAPTGGGTSKPAVEN